MRFWDTSAVVATLVDEPRTAVVRALLAADPDVVAWALTAVEATSALWRRHRASELDDVGRLAAEQRLGTFEAGWRVVVDLEPVATGARALLARQPLRAADAVQLAAALFAAGGDPTRLPFVTLDDHLAAAARAEGFATAP